MLLRPYQSEALLAVDQALAERDDNPCVVLPTGAGKSVVMAAMTKRYLEAWPTTRIIVLAHVRELVQQNAEKLAAHWPQAPLGIYSASLGLRDTRQSVIFASIQSVYRRAAELGPFDLVLVDEAHRIPIRGEGMYRSFLADARALRPHLRVIGMTATPFRLGPGMVIGPDYLLNHIAINISVRDLIEQGYLCRLTSKATRAHAELEGVRVRGGEYKADDLEQAALRGDLVERTAREIAERCAARNAWLIFAAGVEHAHRVSRALSDLGVRAPVVTGNTPREERDRAITAHKRGSVRALVNVNVLSEGYDAPQIDAVVMLRPTKSAGLYYQQVGRGLRLHPSKADCIAEGQRILTDHGLIPIERITKEFRVWDGEEFVAHEGAIYQGARDVIEYAGLKATRDHRVWTNDGWRPLAQCAEEKASIRVTGVGRHPVREADCRVRRGGQEGPAEQTPSVGYLRNLWRGIIEGLQLIATSNRWVPSVWQSPESAKVACVASNIGEAEMHKPERLSLFGLRGARDSIRVRITARDGIVDSGELRCTSEIANRPYRQRWPLRRREPETRHSIREPEKHSKTKAHVWDIVNAGPRNRFTVEGLLVSNCLILDFANNIAEHGPIDAIEVQEKRAPSGPAPLKVCPECDEIVPAGTRECPSCNYLWPEPEAPEAQHEDRPSELAILSQPPERIEVDSVSYHRHEGRSRVPTLRVDYQCGMLAYREWVCLEHEGFARRKAERWWRERHWTQPPATVDKALEAIQADSALEPESIYVRVAGKYPEITGYAWPRDVVAAAD